MMEVTQLLSVECKAFTFGYKSCASE